MDSIEPQAITVFIAASLRDEAVKALHKPPNWIPCCVCDPPKHWWYQLSLREPTDVSVISSQFQHHINYWQQWYIHKTTTENYTTAHSTVLLAGRQVINSPWRCRGGWWWPSSWWSWWYLQWFNIPAQLTYNSSVYQPLYLKDKYLVVLLV